MMFPLESKQSTIIEPAKDKTYSKTYETSEDTDQSAHPRSLIRVCADRMCFYTL